MVETHKPTIVVPDDIVGSFKSSPGIERLRQIATVVFHEQRASGEAELIERIRDANVDPVVPPGLHQVSQAGPRRRADSCG